MHSDHESCGCGCSGHEQIAVPEDGAKDWAAAPDHDLVCWCSGATKKDILEAINGGAFTLPLLKVMTRSGYGRDCKEKHPSGRSCEWDLARLLEIYGQAGPQGSGGGCCG